MPVDKGDEDVTTEPAQTVWFPSEEQQPDELPPSTTDPASSDSNEAPPSEGITSDEARIAAMELDEKYLLDFEGLLYLGALRDEFKWAGHTFQIKTLTVDDTLEVGLLVKRYDDTIGTSRAYLTATVAAALERVDGKPVHSPLGPQDSPLEDKFRYIKDGWYSWTVDRIYNQLMALEARVAQIIEAMGEVSG